MDELLIQNTNGSKFFENEFLLLFRVRRIICNMHYVMHQKTPKNGLRLPIFASILGLDLPFSRRG